MHLTWRTVKKNLDSNNYIDLRMKKVGFNYSNNTAWPALEKLIDMSHTRRAQDPPAGDVFDL